MWVSKSESIAYLKWIFPFIPRDGYVVGYLWAISHFEWRETDRYLSLDCDIFSENLTYHFHDVFEYDIQICYENKIFFLVNLEKFQQIQ